MAAASPADGSSSIFLKRGWSANRARKSAMLICAALVVPIIFAARARNLWVAVALIGLAAASHQGFSVNLYTLVSDMFPQRAVGSVVGIGGFGGAVAGMLVATFTGFLLQFTGSYVPLIRDGQFGLSGGAPGDSHPGSEAGTGRCGLGIGRFLPITWAPQYRQARILYKTWIRRRQPAKIKDASPVGANDSRMLAIRAKANRCQAACAVAFRDAHRLRCDSAIRLRVAALNLRLFLGASALDAMRRSSVRFYVREPLGWAAPPFTQAAGGQPFDR